VLKLTTFTDTSEAHTVDAIPLRPSWRDQRTNLRALHQLRSSHCCCVHTYEGGWASDQLVSKQHSSLATQHVFLYGHERICL